MLQEHKNKIIIEPQNYLQFSQFHNNYAKAIIKLKNVSSYTLHFYIISTLYPNFNIEPNSCCIEPNQIRSILISIQYKKNITYANQYIQIIFQEQPFITDYVLGTLADSKIIQVNIISDQNKYPIIPQMIELSKSLFENGNNYLKRSQYEEALVAYLQAFDNNKYNLEIYISLAQSYRKLNNKVEALIVLQTLLLYNKNNINALILKSKIYAEIAQNREQSYDKIKIFQLAKLILSSIIQYKTNTTEIVELIGKINSEQKKIANYEYFETLGYLEQKVIFKDNQSFQNFKYKDLFVDYQDFNSFFKQAFQEIKYDIPEYVIDPLSYEIFKNPMIVYSGVSYQEKSLNDSFRFKGIYDPITKKPLTRATILYNTALKQYIQNHSNLKKWNQIENSIRNFTFEEIQF